ncbi:MAG TPA: hypothetical protein VGQ57_17675 [Polyangiaceae bacterium]|nr:hypothetical protein [Polyangiaceae bacterium]
MTDVPPAPHGPEVEASALDDGGPDNDYPLSIARLRGKPFTGVVVERDAGNETRWQYVEGRRHGEYREVDANGLVRAEGRYVEGLPSGERRDFGPDGALRAFHRYGERGVLEHIQNFRAGGELFYERTRELERTWYSGGVLRSERRDGVRWAYARDGRCAYGEGVQQQEQSHVYDHFQFFVEVMKDSCLELLDDYDFERGVWMWIHQRLDARDASVLADLRLFLEQANLGARATALQIIGNRGLRELAPELRALLGDQRVPPSVRGEYPGQGGRGHSFSLAKTARLMLDKLG